MIGYDGGRGMVKIDHVVNGCPPMILKVLVQLVKAFLVKIWSNYLENWLNIKIELPRSHKI